MRATRFCPLEVSLFAVLFHSSDQVFENSSDCVEFVLNVKMRIIRQKKKYEVPNLDLLTFLFGRYYTRFTRPLRMQSNADESQQIPNTALAKNMPFYMRQHISLLTPSPKLNCGFTLSR